MSIIRLKTYTRQRLTGLQNGALVEQALSDVIVGAERSPQQADRLSLRRLIWLRNSPEAGVFEAVGQQADAACALTPDTEVKPIVNAQSPGLTW